MKRMIIVLLSLFFIMSVPMLAAAASHGDQSDHDKMSSDMQHGSMDHSKEMSGEMHMGGHDMGEFVEAGKVTQDGVVANVMVKTYDEKAKATMSKMGMSATHHVMVSFTDEKTGKPITTGTVAVMVKGQDAKPAMMMKMGEGFGGDVTLNEKGMYTLEIGTKLQDGNKRRFDVEYHNM
jgi:hypothetical protein